MSQPLIHKGDNDYVFDRELTSVWIEVEGVSIYIRKHEGEVVVEAYPVGQEDIDSTLLGRFRVQLGD